MGRLRILGSGTSTGVPEIGCTCPVCTSTDPRDNRLRASSLLHTDDAVILIDCGPDFREQMLRGVVNGNYALQNSLKIADAIASEDKTDDAVRQYVNVLAVKAGNEESPKIKALVEALLSDDVKNFIQTRYGGAVVAVF